ncbi:MULTISPECIES: DUF4344 domain-containing metallopeptidase [Psychrilyobacter]|uniref:Metallopeptidase n=1 Tax=Psychrilyobacter piezotolerans TaxID=2293438 RepID=A0ABX9KJN0_9FUSO|nr:MULTISPECIES: DUF4344 domain-containing metallopeptidase [Psychrilyobacter]MCS5420881.1 DUF4344 domain-containing metallopeptidase [Psychrilyobacter sp. S5]NDI76800.1 hypothetical protein [Psychrilyobacter piezotolerans]RDE65084.1 hypothetical protein DV867_02485 [Psychrilyobacter sp. S5]REI42654.1 hypothetical protein DYH56_02485 [Psychrilyobacter piezotolerans]
MKKVLVLFMLNIMVVFGEVQLRYSPPTEKKEKEVREWMIKNRVIENLVDTVNKEIKIEEELLVVVGDGDSVHYNSENREIVITYDFVMEVRERFKDEYEKEWEIYAKDSIEHTFYHELGHALVDLLNIPVLGKEEDAVDDFGIIMLILTSEDGEERAISAAELFFMEGMEVEEYSSEDLMDEHSLDDQRGYRSLSLVYGSNPEKYEDIAEDLKMDEDMRLMSQKLFEQQSINWLRLLEPHLKDGILLKTYKEFE